MSISISNSLSIMPNLLYGVDQLSAQNNVLTAEESTNVAADSFSGLGDQTYSALNLEPQITALGAWQTNLTQSQTKLATTQSALGSINTIAANLQNSLTSLASLNSPSGITAASSTAKRELTQLTSLLNTQSGNTYVFAGTASDQPPVSSTDLASTSMVSSIMSAVAGVGASGAAATEAATLALASDNSAGNSVFSSQLSTSAPLAAGLVPQVQVGQSDVIANGVVATQGGPATAQSTGSPIRDLISALATVAGLSGADPTSAGFTRLVSDTANQMQGVSAGIQGLIATVGETQANVTTQGTSLSDARAALQAQLNTIMDTDQATVRSQQLAVQNQLTASYSLISDMKTLTLAQYL